MAICPRNNYQELPRDLNRHHCSKNLLVQVQALRLRAQDWKNKKDYLTLLS